MVTKEGMHWTESGVLKYSNWDLHFFPLIIPYINGSLQTIWHPVLKQILTALHHAGKTRGKHLAFYIQIGRVPQQPASPSWHQVNRWPNTHLLRPRFGKKGIKLKVLSMNVSERIARALEVDSVPPRENSQAIAARVRCNSCRFLQPAARSLPCAVLHSSYTELQ